MFVRMMLCAVMFLSVARVSVSETRLFDFNAGVLDDFEVFDPGEGWTIETNPRIGIRGDRSGDAGVRSTFFLNGDFDISVEVPLHSLTRPPCCETWLGLTVTTLNNETFSTRIIRDEDGSRISRKITKSEETVAEGGSALRVHTMQIGRTGAVISGMLIEDNRTFGADAAFSTGPVRVDMWVHSENLENYVAQAAFDNLSVTADTIFEQQPLVGDTFPLDGRVDIDDLNNVRNRFGDGEIFGPPVPGDTFPFDGIVDLGDLNRVRNFFGTTAAAVPEPSSLALASLLAFVAGIARRRRI